MSNLHFEIEVLTTLSEVRYTRAEFKLDVDVSDTEFDIFGMVASSLGEANDRMKDMCYDHSDRGCYFEIIGKKLTIQLVRVVGATEDQIKADLDVLMNELGQYGVFLSEDPLNQVFNAQEKEE